MLDLFGLIYAYHSYPALNELVIHRTSASLPFCSRYRLIDFAISSMTNAGVRDVGIVMQKNYQSLLNHLEGGKDWDLDRGNGGLTMMPPYGTNNSDKGQYRGSMESLSSVRSYIENIRQNHVVLFRGDLAVNLDLVKIYEQHIASGAEITAVCTQDAPDSDTIRFLPDEDGKFASKMHLRHSSIAKGLCSIEVYIIDRMRLLEMIDWCQANARIHFHQDALARYLRRGGKVGIYIHEGYVSRISSVLSYYKSNLDMLNFENRDQLFPDDQPVYTKGRSSVSTYYDENASVTNSLIADGCKISGEVENCVIFRGVKIKKGAKLSNCIIMADTIVSEDAELTCVISDKNVFFNRGVVLMGNSSLPLTVPKNMIV
ncbi:MAG: glucose-1-phosphate adenylyltransferase subunit GlgD [Oscillospiraceae bacterium]|jgi:glucose-1-phosphate adenylyltransferase|nr:glucose-1-phosphate adenylyltransferase subunit GlgD [Oscillospiraceae bacterium]